MHLTEIELMFLKSGLQGISKRYDQRSPEKNGEKLFQKSFNRKVGFLGDLVTFIRKLKLRKI